MKLNMSPVKQLAQRRGLAVFQPVNLRGPEALERLRAVSPEVMVVAAYGLILPPAVLEVAPAGALNIHASLLPRWRGAAPIQRALLAGDAQTGITIMQMDAGLDTGAMIATRSVPIAADDTAATLHDTLAALGAELILETLRQFGSGSRHATPQPSEGITYAHKIDKSEAGLDWRRSNTELDRQVRAFNPFPGASTGHDGETLKIWRARLAEGTASPGEVIASGDDGVLVACGEGALLLTELQRAGAKRLVARDFLRGHRFERGARLALPG